MSEIDATKYAGEVLRKLIKENYSSQEEFAFEFGADIRTVSRYINDGIGKVATLQEMAMFFHVNLREFLPETLD